MSKIKEFEERYNNMWEYLTKREPWNRSLFDDDTNEYIQELKKQLKEKDLYIETLKYNVEKNGSNKKNCNCNDNSIFELGRSQ
jgi:hypothetical protein